MTGHLVVPGDRSGPAGDAVPPDPHRSAARRTRLRRPDRHRRDRDAGRGPALRSGRRHRRGAGRRCRRGLRRWRARRRGDRHRAARRDRRRRPGRHAARGTSRRRRRAASPPLSAWSPTPARARAGGAERQAGRPPRPGGRAAGTARAHRIRYARAVAAAGRPVRGRALPRRQHGDRAGDAVGRARAAVGPAAGHRPASGSPPPKTTVDAPRSTPRCAPRPGRPLVVGRPRRAPAPVDPRRRWPARSPPGRTRSWSRWACRRLRSATYTSRPTVPRPPAVSPSPSCWPGVSPTGVRSAAVLAR